MTNNPQDALRLALQTLYDETADYIRLNNLGHPHQNQSMRMARDALAQPAQQPVAVPEDFYTHQRAWRKALVIAYQHGEFQQPDIDDKAYWLHELAAFDRAYAMLYAAPTPPAAEQ